MPYMVTFTINIPQYTPVLLAFGYHTYGSYGSYGMVLLIKWQLSDCRGSTFATCGCFAREDAHAVRPVRPRARRWEEKSTSGAAQTWRF